jgi:hypothetical protein
MKLLRPETSNRPFGLLFFAKFNTFSFLFQKAKQTANLTLLTSMELLG